MGDKLKVAVPVEDGPVATESCWATPVDVAGGRYQLENVLLFTDGVGVGDVVLCEPDADGRLIVTTVLARSPLVTVLLVPSDDDACGGGGLATLEPLVRAFGRQVSPVHAEAGMGMAALAFPAVRLEAFVEACRSTAPGHLPSEPRHWGAWRWEVLSEPSLPVPQRIEGAAALLQADGTPLVAVAWPERDDLAARRLEPSVVDGLREVAMYDGRVRAQLAARRYALLVALLVRRAEIRPGSPPFPLLVEDDGIAAARRRWQVSRRGDGTVRWDGDDDLDQRIRAVLRRCGLDPDADPYDPAGAASGSR